MTRVNYSNFDNLKYVMTALEIQNNTSNISTSSLGVKFSENVSIEEWEIFGGQIGKLVNSSQFIIGDWLNFGREKWDRGEFKKRVEIAEVNTGLDPDTLRVYSCLARRVPFENRNPNCSFQHHRIVAKLEPQEQSKWLNIAEKKAMTGKRLRASIVAGKPLTVEEFAPKKNISEQPHNYDDCLGFVHDIQRWFNRNKERGYFDDMDIEQLAFERDKLKPVAEIYNEFNAMIRGATKIT